MDKRHTYSIRLDCTGNRGPARHLITPIPAREGCRILGWRRPHQSALTPANLTTLPHFSVSSTKSLPKSAGDPGSTTALRSVNRVFRLGSARPALTTRLSKSIISGGVFLGTPMPYHALDS